MSKVHCKTFKTIDSHKVYRSRIANQLFIECESSIPRPPYMCKPTLTIVDQSLTGAVEIQKKIKKKWNIGKLPLFHTYHPFKLRNLSYTNWFTHLFTNMNSGVEGSLHVRQMWWIMTISKVNIAQMASNLAHGCILAWQWIFTLGATRVVEEKMVILQFVVNRGSFL